MTSIVTVSPDQQLRLAEIGELTALAYLADGVINSSHPDLPELRDALARAEHAYLLMAAEGEQGQGAAVGTITLVPPTSELADPDTAEAYELRMLAVSPLARGRGVGAMLARHALHLAGSNGAARVVLRTMDSMVAAHHLYESIGFVREPSLDREGADGVRRLGYACPITGP